MMSKTLRRRRFLWRPLLPALLAVCAAGCGKTYSVATVPTEADANEMIHALYNRRIAARKEPIGEGKSRAGERKWQVFVDEGLLEENKLAAALQVLHEHGLPRPADKGFEKAYEEGGMFPSESAQKAQRLKELKTEIERQLRYLPGVARVSVNVVLPEESGIKLNPYPATASVLLVHKNEKPAFSDDYIKELVARGVPKLKAAEVGVMLVYEPAPSAGDDARAAQPTAKGGRSVIVWAVAAGVLAALAAVGAVFLLQRRRRAATEEQDSGGGALTRLAEQSS